MSAIARVLEQAPYSLHTLVLSIDDFYLCRKDQLQLAASLPDNPLVQHRGQPSTHDHDLAISVLSSLRARQETSIPSYDKSAFDGKGDRVPQDKWAEVNGEGQPPVELVILEGWCLGFRSLDNTQLTARWENAVKARDHGQGYNGRLGYNRFEDIRWVNEALKDYDAITK